MGIFDRFRGTNAAEEIYDDYDYQEEYNDYDDGYEDSYEDNTVAFSTADVKFRIFHPAADDDYKECCRQLADYLREGNILLMNLDRKDEKTRDRMVNFMSGVVYSEDADMAAASKHDSLWVICPHGVSMENFRKTARF